MSARAEISRARVNQDRVVGALKVRLTGPGGFYNIGNAIGLAMGLLLQIRRSDPSSQDVVMSLATHFVGDWTAAALTAATVVFFWSGEEYHRAWSGGLNHRDTRIRRGDFLSGVGAAFLGVSLFLIGDIWLAASAGALHAAGKLGSAALGSSDDSQSATFLRGAFRWSVVASRVPAILIAVIGVGGLFADPGRADAGSALMLVTLLICYGLWTAADLMLLGPLPKRS